MQLFSCSECQQPLFFESVGCTSCGRTLAYLPDRAIVSALAQDGGANLWRALNPIAGGAEYRLCQNYSEYSVCNWAVPAGDPEPFCRACRLNRLIPNLSQPGAMEAWRRLELAKRRLVHSLLELGLPVVSRDADPRGVSFSFLRDGETPAERIATGHQDGVITINIAEADDPFRERMRVSLGETYRTLLGHFRHEIGHYYWDRLVRDSPFLPRFRALFGDEQADYASAQQRHYAAGPPPNWQAQFVSAYASMHPWEDWAETWAHYLHMVDTLDTARAYGLSVRAAAKAGTLTPIRVKARRLDLHDFDDLIDGWVPLTLALNSLNRSMGTADSYPFVLSQPATEKLRFVHDVIAAAEA
jgi:hypothetical protein